MASRSASSGALRRGAQDGFTLVELLVTLVLLGSAFVILVGGTLTGVVSSNNHREQADGEVVLRRFADEVALPRFPDEVPISSCPESLPETRTFPETWDDGYILQIEECRPVVPPAEGVFLLRIAVEPVGDEGEPDNGQARLEVETVTGVLP
ncbi:MAG: prepilin-type N-terminal cleavage/methylation domain-containing protein [Acidimicrobiales bacterium]